VVPPADAEHAVALLSAHHPGSAVIGHATADAGAVELRAQRLRGTRTGFVSE
jgi:hypothetical protein